MQCTHWQEAISARLDGEEPGVESRLLDAHLAACAECRSFAAASEQALRFARVQAAPAIPDLSTRVTKATALADRAASWSLARAVLAVVAVQVIAFAVRTLFWGPDGSTVSHESRHVGAFGIAYGVGLLVVAARPARARTMLPVASVLAATLTITALFDIAHGNVPAIAEADHLPEVISVVLVWLLASPSRGRTPASETSDDRHLRVVASEPDIGPDAR